MVASSQESLSRGMAVTTHSNQLGTVSAIRGEMLDSFAYYKRGRDQLEQVLGTALHWNFAMIAYKLAGLYIRQLANEEETQKAKKGMPELEEPLTNDGEEQNKKKTPSCWKMKRGPTRDEHNVIVIPYKELRALLDRDWADLMAKSSG